MKMSGVEYGWNDGKLVLEKTPLTREEIQTLEVLTEVAFREMAERTRTGSGDDQYCVDGALEFMKGDKNYAMLVQIVYRLMKNNMGEKHETETRKAND